MFGHPRSQGRCIARADHRDQRAFEQGGIADAPQNGGRAVDVGQIGGVIGIADAEHARPGPARGLHFGQNDPFGTNFIICDASGAGNLGQRIKGGARGAVFGQKAVKRNDSNTARAQQTKPVQPIIFRGGWEWGVSGRKSFFGHLLSSACCRIRFRPSGLTRGEDA